MQSAKEVQQAWNLLISKGLLNYLQFGEAGSSKSWLPIVGVFKTKVAFQRYELWNGLKTQPKAVVFQQVVKQTNMILSPIPDYISRFHARDFFHVGPRPDILLPHPYGCDAFQSARTALGSTEGEVMRPVRKDHQFFFLSGILPGLKTTAGSLGEEILSEVLDFFFDFLFSFGTSWNILVVSIGTAPILDEKKMLQGNISGLPGGISYLGAMKALKVQKSPFDSGKSPWDSGKSPWDSLKKSPFFWFLMILLILQMKNMFPPTESEKSAAEAASYGSFMARRCWKPCECMEGPFVGRHHVTRKLWRLCHSICLTKILSLLVVDQGFWAIFLKLNSEVDIFVARCWNATDSMKMILVYPEIVMSLQENDIYNFIRSKFHPVSPMTWVLLSQIFFSQGSDMQAILSLWCSYSIGCSSNASARRVV